MENFYAVIENCPLFDGISLSEFKGMLGCLNGRVLEMKKGQPVLREGDATNQMGVILSGSVQVIREDYYGERSVLSHIGPAQIFGEAYAFSQAQALPVSVVPDQDGKVLMLDSRRIASCCANACEFHNKMIFNLLRLVADKSLMLHQKIEITSRRTTREKLLTYLAYQAKLQNSNTFTIPFDRQALADYLGVERSAMSAELSKLQKDGILETKGSRFTLTV